MTRGKAEPVLQRIFQRTEVADCWTWTGATTNGYGRIGVGGKTALVHRVVWAELVRPERQPETLDHLCRNRACCNPDHLEPVSIGENARRGYSPSVVAGSTNTCVRGHSLSDAYVDAATGRRRCRQCTRDKNRKQYAAHAAARVEYARNRRALENA